MDRRQRKRGKADCKNDEGDVFGQGSLQYYCEARSGLEMRSTSSLIQADIKLL